MTSLEGWGFTIKLRPHLSYFEPLADITTPVLEIRTANQKEKLSWGLEGYQLYPWVIENCDDSAEIIRKEKAQDKHNFQQSLCDDA
jgi:hypothetical protein